MKFFYIIHQPLTFENLHQIASRYIILSISLLQLKAAVFNPEKDISKLLTLIKGLGRLTFLVLS